MKLNNKIYDVLKIICLVVCPAFNVCITTLNLLWGWDLPIEAITGSISAIALFVGTCLGFSSAKYKKEQEAVFKEE